MFVPWLRGLSVSRCETVVPFFFFSPISDRSAEAHACKVLLQAISLTTMNTATKLLNAMRQNPNDWGMGKLLTVAKQHSLEVRSTGGSHHVFSHPSVKDSLSVPAHRPIKAIYIKRFIALIDQIQENKS